MVRVSLEVGFFAAASDLPTLNPSEGGLCHFPDGKSRLTIMPATKFSDELIRQVTLNCPERGLLLLRVRDEARMTIAAYQTLYER